MVVGANNTHKCRAAVVGANNIRNGNKGKCRWLNSIRK
jgi:hypothetical protein